uniref:Squalene cyclase C-terminal domain-containing protein n=1 Tax=Arundo donax TaxID=35708 RepID=A0A0A9DPR7_ARUDO
MLACWIEDPNSEEFKLHIPRVHDYFWLAEDGMKMQGYNGSQLWDTAFTMQAIVAADLIKEFGPTLKLAHDYIKNSQLTNPTETFGDIMIDYPYVECTSAAVQALTSFRMLYPGHRRKEVDNCIRKAANFIESVQRSDGSWYGSWAVCFTYDIWFGVKGLIASGRTFENSPAIERHVTFCCQKSFPLAGGEKAICHLRTRFTPILKASDPMQ